MKKLVLAASAVLALTQTAGAQNYPWKPERPVTIIVPWAAGGSTDQVTRVAAAEVEKKLGQKIVIVNQPGASGSIGTRNALQAPKDGYTWTAGAAKDIGTYVVSGLLDTKITDWRLYLSVINVSVLGANNNTPYKSAADLVAAMKAKPGHVSVATAGINSSGHSGIESFTRALGITYKHVSYDGGNPAVIATVAGETELTTQLAVEQANMIRAKRLKALAVLSDKPLELEGYGTIPAVTKEIPAYKPEANYFGIFVPKDSPPEVIKTLDMIWADLGKNEALKKYATQNGAILDPSFGDDALKAAMPAITAAAWLLHEGGKAKVSPDTVGIPKPTN
ncbi:tripartite tricarboxylate transporter family receptor [Variibacter gotjawalensis]|uniref:Tripartite tricarboxylate transporter family receptor n=1 Tax=Variibacter gotjawalensis TaxID=1333996 RepID=A0A0S3PTK6_9BRAD|nr:tripartite tricarboxylate transporter substrate binding protein [Variibacter gotjawalensis]NIK49465.1 tripartite-type tricarboxylate transporter receptor subunit TctC [Variibacter gotjawalensis]RZS51317.1 tripartite-type tricarboxylate transporter receptor subunit TctC [Variibacter gotjawalensis]BAT59150.1 tripartite tricarboxylate transporter family receptor [Variibacter gotjawalensis]